MAICIVGWHHSRFGRLDADLEQLTVAATAGALADAGVAGADIDAVYVSHFNAGLVPDAFLASLPMQADPGLRFKPATRVENACASGSAAIYQGMQAIEAGRARLVLVVGVEKMTAVGTAEVTAALAGASYVAEEAGRGLTFPGIFAALAREYFERYGDKSAALARIAAKNHHNGSRNPLAHLQKDLGFDFCNTVSAKNPLVAPPLRVTDCALISDGAAALVLADTETARRLSKAVRFRAAQHVNDLLPMSRRDMLAFEGPALAWRRALGEAGVRLDNLAFAEVHDCFTIAELLTYEAMGLTPPGQGERAINAGWTARDGRLPVNPSGGLKAKGHPIGATGVSMHVLAAMQLCGQAGAFQVPDAALGAVFNMGGSAVASYVSVLEPLKA